MTVRQMNVAGKWMTAILATAASAAAVNGTAIDTVGFDIAEFVFGGNQTGTVTSCAFKLQESDDGSTNWTDVAAADTTVPTVTILTANHGRAGSISVGLGGARKRYLRVVATPAGGAPTVNFAAFCLLHQQSGPVPYKGSSRATVETGVATYASANHLHLSVSGEVS